MSEIFDISYDEIDIIKNLWEKNRQYHENSSEYFKESYRCISFDQRIKAFSVFKSEAIKISVAKSGNEYIGYCISTITDGRGELESLHVDETNRGNGIGKKLVTQHLEWMNEKNCNVIGVTVSQENEATILFYKKLGFYPNTLYMQQKLESRISLVKGDITKLDVDAIVNAANSSLLGGGGVDGAIHKAGGKQILEECMAIRNKQVGCETGEAVITTGGLLKARFVIHTVGPVWNGGNNEEDRLLSNCYINSLKLAEENHIKTIAFSNISTGVYAFPKERAANIAVQTVLEYLSNDESIEKVIFVCFDEENYQLYSNLI